MGEKKRLARGLEDQMNDVWGWVGEEGSCLDYVGWDALGSSKATKRLAFGAELDAVAVGWSGLLRLDGDGNQNMGS